jgi:hypothetical protein
MALGMNKRGLRAATTMLACAALVASAPAAGAAGKPKHPKKKQHAALKESNGKKPSAKKPSRTAVTLPVAARLGPVGPAPAAQLAAMNTAITVAPVYFRGLATGCTSITPVLVDQPGPTIGGNFRDSGGGCYVWVNLSQSAMLTGPEICKTTLHEVGHLMGLEHSADPNDVMFSPFRSDPIPGVCLPKTAASQR